MINLLFMFMIFFMMNLLILMLNYFISKKKNIDREKSSPFECGFDPFNSARLPFSIQFYLISMIFLIFDVEIIIFLPMIHSFLYNKYIFWMETSIYFIIILLTGLYIEWNEGALNWIK